MPFRQRTSPARGFCHRFDGGSCSRRVETGHVAFLNPALVTDRVEQEVTMVLPRRVRKFSNEGLLRKCIDVRDGRSPRTCGCLRLDEALLNCDVGYDLAWKVVGSITRAVVGGFTISGCRGNEVFPAG